MLVFTLFFSLFFISSISALSLGYDDFETDFGHWAIHNGINCADLNAWGQRGTSTNSLNTGPQNGGVGGAGTNFIYVETSSSSEGCYNSVDKAFVYFNETLNYGSSSNEKIEFYFHAYGSDIDDLYLEENSTGSWVKLWEMHDIDNNYWNFTSVDLSSLTGSGTLRFNYTRTSTGFESDISLDRINVTFVEGGGGDVPIESEYDDITKDIIQILQALIIFAGIFIMMVTVKLFYQGDITFGRLFIICVQVGLGLVGLLFLGAILIKYMISVIS